jgi:UDP-N-acetyl-D-glucosamine dehydrogenase
MGESSGKVGIIGLGFVGLPLALAFVRKGFEMIGIDLDVSKIAKLNQGQSYIRDIEDSEIALARATRRFKVSSRYEDLVDAGSIIICVPTPLTPYHTPDLSYLIDTCNRLSPLLRRGQLVVLESSTFPGTTKEVVQPILERSKLTVGQDIYLAYSPERIDPGNHLPIEQIPKLASGATGLCLDKVHNLYSQVFDSVVKVSTTEAAETAKLLENTFRLVNISFINEFAQICDAMNIDVWEVIAAAGTKPYGFTAFYPGPGAGGHCIPVDPLYMQWKARQFGIQSQFIELSNKINTGMTDYIVNRLKQLLITKKKLSESRILVYGVTYKRDIPDIRESTALELIQLLTKEGAIVSYHDPLISSVVVDGVGMSSIALTDEAIRDSDCVIIHTNHSSIPLKLILEHAPLVFDTRNVTGDLGERDGPDSLAKVSKIVKLGGGSV